MRRLARRGIATAALLRGIEGFGINRRIHAQRFPDVSTDLPLLAMVVDARRRVEAALDDVDRAVPRGLVTLERRAARHRRGRRPGRVPGRAGRAAKLTIYCGSDERAGRRPAYREAVDVLRRHGATGAIVLAGVDGLRRRPPRPRAPLQRERDAPMVIISVGPPEPAARRAARISPSGSPRRSSRSSGSRRSSTTASCSSRRRRRPAPRPAPTSGRRSGSTRDGPPRSTGTRSTAS